jgi:hypothetical protein
MLEFIRSDSQSIVLAAARDRRGVGSFGASRSIDCLSNMGVAATTRLNVTFHAVIRS